MSIQLRSQHRAAIVWGIVTIALGVVLVVDVGWDAAIFWMLLLIALWIVFAFWFRRYRLASGDPERYTVRRWLNDLQEGE